MTDIDIAQCKITHYPSEVIRTPAKPVEKIDRNTRKLVDRMIDIMIETRGIGLAAPQAGVPLRIFVISLQGDRENAKAYINPVVTATGDLTAAEEGCLSVPGIYTKIRRYNKATVTATDLDGNKFTEEAEGLYARALQHEYDHLQGMTIVNKMSQTARIKHRKQLKKLKEKGDSQ